MHNNFIIKICFIDIVGFLSHIINIELAKLHFTRFDIWLPCNKNVELVVKVGLPTATLAWFISDQDCLTWKLALYTP